MCVCVCVVVLRDQTVVPIVLELCHGQIVVLSAEGILQVKCNVINAPKEENDNETQDRLSLLDCVRVVKLQSFAMTFCSSVLLDCVCALKLQSFAMTFCISVLLDCVRMINSNLRQ